MNIDHTIGNTTITANNSKFPKNTPTQEEARRSNKMPKSMSINLNSLI